MSEVWDTQHGRSVALKRLHVPDSEIELDAFEREAQLSQLLQHPNIVEVFEVGADDEGPWFTMRYVHGGETLDRVIDRLRSGDPEYHRRYPIARRAKILQQVCDALQYAHELGVVHRDVKPGNILVSPERVLLLDWGMAWVDPEGRLGDQVGNDIEEDGVVFGTPLYMAPEQLLRGVTPQVDVYGATAVLHELLTLEHYLGDPAWEFQDLWPQIFRQPPVPVEGCYHVLQDRIPKMLAEICARGLAKEPKTRTESADALRDALQSWLDEVEKAPAAVRRRWWIPQFALPAFGLCLVVAAIALVSYPLL